MTHRQRIIAALCYKPPVPSTQCCHSINLTADTENHGNGLLLVLPKRLMHQWAAHSVVTAVCCIVAVTSERQNLSFFQKRFWKIPLKTTYISRFSSWKSKNLAFCFDLNNMSHLFEAVHVDHYDGTVRGTNRDEVSPLGYLQSGTGVFRDCFCSDNNNVRKCKET